MVHTLKLWHQKLIRYLPTETLRKLHEECCEYREKNPLDFELSSYHMLVIDELAFVRKIEICWDWSCYNFCGEKRGYAVPDDRKFRSIYSPARDKGKMIFANHDENLLLENLEELKGEELVGASVEELTIKAEAERTA